MGNKISFPEVFSSNFQIVMIGLDNAGKSTILYRLKLDQYVTTMPTIGFNCEKIKPRSGNAKGMSFTIWDVGGQERIRPLWRSYIRHTNAILFVVDSNDEERFEEAKVELTNLMRCPEMPAHAPVIILANKQDLPSAKCWSEMEKYLGVACCSRERDNSTTTTSSSSAATAQFNSNLNRITLLIPCCAVTGEGLDDCFDTIYDLITKAKAKKCEQQHQHNKNFGGKKKK